MASAAEAGSMMVVSALPSVLNTTLLPFGVASDHTSNRVALLSGRLLPMTARLQMPLVSWVELVSATRVRRSPFVMLMSPAAIMTVPQGVAATTTGSPFGDAVAVSHASGAVTRTPSSAFPGYQISRNTDVAPSGTTKPTASGFALGVVPLGHSGADDPF